MTREDLNAYIRLLGHFATLNSVFDDEVYDDATVRRAIADPKANDLDRSVGEALLAIEPAERWSVCDQSMHRPPQDMSDAEVVALHRIATAADNDINAAFAGFVLRERGLPTSANRALC